MVDVFAKLGPSGFDGNGSLLEGVRFHSSFDWEKVPAYYLADYFKARVQEDLPLNEHERTLYEFLKCYSVHANWLGKPASDLPVEDSVVFKPERVQAIAARLGNLDLEKALEWYQCVGPGYVASYWPRELIQAHLRKVIAFCGEAAANGPRAGIICAANRRRWLLHDFHVLHITIISLAGEARADWRGGKRNRGQKSSNSDKLTHTNFSH